MWFFLAVLRDTSFVTDTFAGKWKIYKDGVIAQARGQDLPNIIMVSTLNSTLMWSLAGRGKGSITWNGDKMFSINGVSRDGNSVIGTYDGISTIKWHGPIFGENGTEFVYLGKQ